MEINQLLLLFDRLDFFLLLVREGAEVVKKYKFIANSYGLRFLHALLRFFTKLLSENFLIFVW